MVGQHTISIISKPLFTQELGWSMEDYSKWITGGGYFFALGGSFLGGLLADRLTAKRTAGTATVVLGIVWIAFSMMEQHWDNRTFAVGFIFAEQFSIGIEKNNRSDHHQFNIWDNVMARLQKRKRTS